nr:hypothetical protein [Sicyoidochytrium minutum DNA virus]
MGDLVELEFGWDSDPEVRMMDREVSLRRNKRRKTSQEGSTAVFRLLTLDYFGDFFCSSSIFGGLDSGNLGAMFVAAVVEYLEFRDFVMLSEVSKLWLAVATKFIHSPGFNRDFSKHTRVAARRATFQALNNDFNRVEKGPDDDVYTTCATDGPFRISPYVMVKHILNGMTPVERVIYNIRIWEKGFNNEILIFAKPAMDPPESYRVGVTKTNGAAVQAMSKSSPEFEAVRHYWWFSEEAGLYLLPWGCNDTLCEVCGRIGAKVRTMSAPKKRLRHFFQRACELCAASKTLRRFTRL